MRALVLDALYVTSRGKTVIESRLPKTTAAAGKDHSGRLSALTLAQAPRIELKTEYLPRGR